MQPGGGRIERVAALVHQKILAIQVNAPKIVECTTDENWSEPSLEDEVYVMDKLEREDQLRSERMTRRIAECTAAGMSAKEAFEVSMREEGLPVPSSEKNGSVENETHDLEYGDSAPAEPWLESLASDPLDIVNEQIERHIEQSVSESHPSVEQAETFLMTIVEFTDDDSKKSNFRNALFQAAMDIVGGLAQGTHGDLDNVTSRALTITKLKRALTGHAYARGAVFGLRSEEAYKQLLQVVGINADSKILDIEDNCQSTPNEDQQDSDEDDVGDLCDDCVAPLPRRDSDLDGVDDRCDTCATGPDAQNEDGDDFADACDACPAIRDDQKDGEESAGPKAPSGHRPHRGSLAGHGTFP